MTREQHSYNVTVRRIDMTPGNQLLRIHVYCEGDSGWFCDNAKLGCSKTFKVATPLNAINVWLKEHGLLATRHDLIED